MDNYDEGYLRIAEEKLEGIYNLALECARKTVPEARDHHRFRICPREGGHALPHCIMPFGVDAEVDAEEQIIRFRK